MKKSSEKPVVEHCLPFSIAKLGREQWLRPGTRWICVLTWPWGGEYSFDVECHTSEKGLFLLARYAIQRGEGQSVSLTEHIDLERESSKVGGWRWWFLCPRCQTRRRVLFIPPGHDRFACRVCHDLRYRASMRSWRMRCWRKVLG